MAMRPGGAGLDPIDIAVGARIRARRCELGLSQEALGALLFLSGQTVRKLETSANISPARLVAIARVLSVDVAYFFAPEDWRRAETDGSVHAVDVAAE
jgi:transcriptional regulator with XRE-family HTH domain